ncbi:copper-binding protein [Cupriavidus sp. IDO]|uniref:copper-binding protein n=1 Tax=Cupriavidus sp. IDO TaxID=1539142 RepID=UPI001EE73718|nr:copper-binding protein [Cupriavidus sp. IDO]
MPQTPREGKAGVRKVNAANGEVALKHGPIENFGMSAMTMTLPIEDKASLAKVKEGDIRHERCGHWTSLQWCGLSHVAMEEALYHG